MIGIDPRIRKKNTSNAQGRMKYAFIHLYMDDLYELPKNQGL